MKPTPSRRRARIAGAVVAAATVVLAGAAPSLAAETRQQRAAIGTAAVATGLNGPSAFTFGPNNRLWYLERGTGRVRILNLTTGGSRTFFRITGVDGAGERGALGIALHPAYPQRPFVYAYATRRQGGRLWNQILRIRDASGSGTNQRVLRRTPVGGATNHNGGRILVGPDEKLWVVTGDNATPSHSQDRTDNLRGKILRLNLDGSVPRTNPFGSAIYAYGIRNSFGFTFDPETGRLWQTENGPACNDEINLIVKGGNYAWGPNWRCSARRTVKDTNRDGPKPRRLPKFRFVSPIGITGAAFCDRCGLGGRRNGDLLFGAVNDGRIRALDLNPRRNDLRGKARVLARTPGGSGIHSMEVSPRGRIFVSTRDAIYRLTP